MNASPVYVRILFAYCGRTRTHIAPMHMSTATPPDAKVSTEMESLWDPLLLSRMMSGEAEVDDPDLTDHPPHKPARAPLQQR